MAESKQHGAWQGSVKLYFRCLVLTVYSENMLKVVFASDRVTQVLLQFFCASSRVTCSYCQILLCGCNNQIGFVSKDVC